MVVVSKSGISDRSSHTFLNIQNSLNVLRELFLNTLLLNYSKIPLLRPPKVKTISPLKSIFEKCQSFFLFVCFLHSVVLITDIKI